LIAGTSPNDLGTKTANFSATVSGNSGNGVANILPGGSFGGYYINRAAVRTPPCHSSAALQPGTPTSASPSVPAPRRA